MCTCSLWHDGHSIIRMLDYHGIFRYFDLTIDDASVRQYEFFSCACKDINTIHALDGAAKKNVPCYMHTSFVNKLGPKASYLVFCDAKSFHRKLTSSVGHKTILTLCRRV